MNAENFISLISKAGKSPPVFLLGTIPNDYVSGRPKVKFDGEDTASVRQYPYLAPYVPAANDRVLVAIVNNGAVILGKVI